MEGLTLFESTHYTTLIFTNDTSLFLNGDYKNIKNTMKVLNLYNVALGAKISLHKTTAI